MHDRHDSISTDRIEERVAILRARLEDGYHRIGAAQIAGEDVERWETFWIQLLRQYEDLCDEAERLASAA